MTHRETRNLILDQMTDEAVPAAMQKVREMTGIAPTDADRDALSDWLQDRFMMRVENAIEDPTPDDSGPGSRWLNTTKA